jgi:hypothetical protein
LIKTEPNQKWSSLLHSVRNNNPLEFNDLFKWSWIQFSN